MLLLISDANILIDIQDGSLTPIVFKLPYEIVVPDVLFETELKAQHSGLLDAGLKVKGLTPESINRIENLRSKYPRPSIMDHLALSLSIQEKCPLLTGDKGLRIAAEKEGVKVHGILWIIEELLTLKIIKPMQAKNSLDSMRASGSRLPLDLIQKLLHRWELTEIVE